jgi:hypothetical protein
MNAPGGIGTQVFQWQSGGLSSLMMFFCILPGFRGGLYWDLVNFDAA